MVAANIVLLCLVYVALNSNCKAYVKMKVSTKNTFGKSPHNNYVIRAGKDFTTGRVETIDHAPMNMSGARLIVIRIHNRQPT